MRLPLDSPNWSQLSACWSAEREIVATRQLGEPWAELRAEILHQGSVYGVTSAALPYLIELAVDLAPEARPDLWIEVGLLVTAGAGRFPDPPPTPGLQEERLSTSRH